MLTSSKLYYIIELGILELIIMRKQVCEGFLMFLKDLCVSGGSGGRSPQKKILVFMAWFEKHASAPSALRKKNVALGG